MSDKIYVGNGKTINTKYGDYLKITVDLDSLIREFENYGFTTNAGKRKIKLDIPKRREPDNYGNTHAVTIDTWKPDDSQPSGYTNNSSGSQQSGFKPSGGFNPQGRYNSSPAASDFKDNIPF
jgi:hypothetical protein